MTPFFLHGSTVLDDVRIFVFFPMIDDVSLGERNSELEICRARREDDALLDELSASCSPAEVLTLPKCSQRRKYAASAERVTRSA
jgi:hypothetical protein